jgi:hypothetical protein
VPELLKSSCNALQVEFQASTAWTLNFLDASTFMTSDFDFDCRASGGLHRIMLRAMETFTPSAS